MAATNYMKTGRRGEENQLLHFIRMERGMLRLASMHAYQFQSGIGGSAVGIGVVRVSSAKFQSA